jgi:xylulokinase
VPTACFLGLDIGTSGVKAILVGSDGDVLATGVTPLQLSTPHPGWAEQDPEMWWRASVAAIRMVLAAQPNARVVSVGISGQMHSSVFLDAHGEVIRPALLWCDGRTTAECREITDRVGGEARLRDLASNPALEGFTLPKVLWLRNHEPTAFARLSTVLLAKDFVRYRLTGALATEPSDASATLMYDTANMRWSTEILAAVELSRSLVPDVGGSADVLGRVTLEAAGLTGLTVGTPVVGGGADNACGAAGVGVITPGEAVTSWGTSGTVLAPTDTPRVDPRLRAHTFCHVAPNTWYIMGVVLSAGGAFAWFRDQLARDQQLRRAACGTGSRLERQRHLPRLRAHRAIHGTGRALGLRDQSSHHLRQASERHAGARVPRIRARRTDRRDRRAQPQRGVAVLPRHLLSGL